MSDVELTLNFEDAPVLDGLKSIEEKLESIDDKTISISETQQKEFKATAEAAKKLDTTLQGKVKTLTTVARETQKANKANIRLDGGLRKIVRSYDILGVNVGEVIDNLQEKQTALKAVQTGLAGTNKFLALFRAALLATGIGAIVVVLGSLVSFLTKTQKGVELANQAFAGFSATVNVVIDRASALGEVIVNIFNRPFRESLAATKSAFSGITDEIVRETQQAIALQKVLDQLQKDEQLLNIERAASRARIKELNLLAEDTTKGTRARSKAAKEAFQIEQRLLNRQVEQQKLLIANQLGLTEVTAAVDEQLQKVASGALSADEVINSLGLSNSTVTDLEEFTGIVVDFFNTQAESLEVQTTLNNKINTIRNEGAAKLKTQQEAERKRVEELTKTYAGLVEQLEARTQDAQLSGLSELQRLEAERDIAIEQIQEFRRELETAAAAVGKDIDLTDEITQLVAQVDREFTRGVKEIRDRFKDVDLLPPLVKPTDFKKEGEEAIKNIVIGASESEIDNSLLQKIKDKIKDVFSLNDEELSFIGGQISNIFSAINGALSGNIDRQIAEQDRLVDAIDNRVSRVDEALNRELELQRQGFANNVGLEREKLETLQAEREAAEKKREQLQRKAAKRQATIEAAQQAGSIITAGANILKGSSNIPFVGVAIGLGLIATMVAAFTKFKNETLQLTRLYGGGRIPLNGRDDRTGRGHRIEDTNIVVGRGEWVVNADASKEHNKLLEGINAGQYKGVDLAEIVNNPVNVIVPKMRENQTVINNQTIERNDTVIAKEYKKGVDRMISFWEERPEYVDMGGYIKKIYKKGGVTYIDRIKKT